jgi:N,N'-diacetyllegionaminate synthase
MKDKVIIIAEAGVNHNGDIRIAKKLIDVASKAKVDYVKFQTFKANSLVSKSAEKAKYQFNKSNETQLEMLKKLELSSEDHYELIRYCSDKNVKFFSTAFDIDSLNFLKNLNLDFFKVPSGEITNYSYLKKIASFDKPVILSTGMSNINEISAAIKILTSKKITLEDITVLHCNTQYPTPFKDVNLKAMVSIRDIFNVKIGYSDHTLGFEVPVAAVALGAKVIEKHFTLNNNFDGPDHLASLEPQELIEMVKRIRNIEKACNGSGKKKISKSEKQNLLIVRKSLFTNNEIKKGDLFNEDNLIALRPGDGLSPMEIPNLEGMTFNKNLKAYSKISKDDFET